MRATAHDPLLGLSPPPPDGTHQCLGHLCSVATPGRHHHHQMAPISALATHAVSPPLAVTATTRWHPSVPWPLVQCRHPWPSLPPPNGTHQCLGHLCSVATPGRHRHPWHARPPHSALPCPTPSRELPRWAGTSMPAYPLAVGSFFPRQTRPPLPDRLSGSAALAAINRSPSTRSHVPCFPHEGRLL